jgi:hypothetical protein
MDPLKGRRGRLQAPEGEEGGGGEAAADDRPTPAEINASQNQARVDRMNKIAQGADGRRAREMTDVDGEKPAGRFAGGELDESPEARERAAAEADAEAEQALRDAEEDAARAEAAQHEEDARRLQSEGAEGSGDGEERRPAPTRETQADEGDERVIDGVRHYATVVAGELKWLTLPQLKAQAGKVTDTERALQDAREAVQRASQLALAPREAPSEIPADLEEIITSANLGDEEAVKKLASVIRNGAAAKTPVDVRSQISEQIATQRAIDAGEREATDLLSNESLGPVFRMRLQALSRTEPTLKIVDAYKKIAGQMRTEFAPMLGNRLPTREQRKRTLAEPLSTAGRQRPEPREEQEEPVSSVIDQLAKSRGQQRAIRQRRY